MEIFNKVKSVCNGNPSELAARFGYPEDTVELIASNDEDDFAKKYAGTYETLLSCRQEKDTRSPFEYGKDIVSMWLLEDIAIDQLQRHGINAERYGVDKERKILHSGEISAKSDFLVTEGDKKLKIEFVTDFTRFWEKTNKIDFRNKKYNKIIENGSALLGIALDTRDKDNKKYILLEDLEKYDHTYFDEHPVWKKPANRVYLPSSEVRKLNWNEIASRIRSIMDRQNLSQDENNI